MMAKRDWSTLADYCALCISKKNMNTIVYVLQYAVLSCVFV